VLATEKDARGSQPQKKKMLYTGKGMQKKTHFDSEGENSTRRGVRRRGRRKKEEITKNGRSSSRQKRLASEGGGKEIEGVLWKEKKRINLCLRKEGGKKPAGAEVPGEAHPTTSEEGASQAIGEERHTDRNHSRGN